MASGSGDSSFNESVTSSSHTMTSSRVEADSSAEHRAEIIYFVCEVVNVVLLAATLWILLCLVVYGLRTKKWKHSRRQSDVNGGSVYTAAILGVGLTVPRYIADQVIFNAGQLKHAFLWCEVVMDVGNASYFLALYAIYLFLWFKQRAFYGHPAMRKLAGKPVQVFSWVTFAALSIAAIAVALLFIIPNDYEPSSDGWGCAVKLSTINASYSDHLTYQGAYYALAGLLLVSQILLLSLFLYPMVRSNMIMKQNSRRASRQTTKGNISNATSVGVKGTLEDVEDDGKKLTRFRSYMSTNLRKVSRRFSSAARKKTNNIEKTIKRSVICAGVSMLSDITALGLMSAVIARTESRTLTNTIYDLSTMVSVVCIVATFESYRQILTVFCTEKAGKQQEKLSMSSVDERGSEKSISFHSAS